MAETMDQVLTRLSDAGGDGEVSMGEVLHVLEDRPIGVLMAALGLMAAIPVIGAIPGVTVLIGALVLLAVVQFFFGGGGLWVPAFVSRRAVDAEAFDRGLTKARPAARWLDRRLRPRLTVLVEGRTRRALIVLATVLLAFSLFPLALVPWGAEPPALGILAFGLALMRRDGLMALVGYALTAATVGLAVTAF